MNKKWLLLILILAITLPGGIYWLQKSTDSHGIEIQSTSQAISAVAPVSRTETPQKTITETKLASVDTLVDGLRKRLDAQPDDIKGWVLLAKSYHHLQRWDEAKMAFDRAKALGYTAELPPLPTNQPSLKQILSAPPANNLSAAIDSTVSAQSIDTPATLPTSVTVDVSIPADFVSIVSPQDSVFIFARSPAGGPPLAVVRKTVGDLPLRLTLDDSMAMMPGNSLSTAKDVIVGARVSSTANPIRSVGDIEGFSAPFSPSRLPPDQQAVVDIIINQQVTETNIK